MAESMMSDSGTADESPASPLGCLWGRLASGPAIVG